MLLVFNLQQSLIYNFNFKTIYKHHISHGSVSVVTTTLKVYGG